MMPSRLIHPKLVATIRRDFFPQTCALKEPQESQSTTGKVLTTYQTYAGYAELPCRVAPASGGERRADRGRYLDATHAIAIPGFYEAVTEKWVAVVDGQQYEILLVERDAEGVMTHLETRIVR